jgi:hypothetical protein
MIGPWPWQTFAVLGAYHGINPGMGWLFAVALGLQGKSRSAVLRALPPIALGHALSIAGLVLLVGIAQVLLPPLQCAACPPRPFWDLASSAFCVLAIRGGSGCASDRGIS